MSSFNSLDTATREQLANKNRLLEQMISMIDAAIWSYDLLANKINFASEALTRITGYPLKKFMDVNDWITTVYPEDIPIFKKLSANIRQGIPDQREYRIWHANGEIRWLQVGIMPSLNADGEVTQFDGVIIDITDRKKMEDELHKSEQRYKSLFEYNSDVICELDLNGNVMDINPTAEKITGERLLGADANFSMDDVFGKDNIQLMTEYFQLALQGVSLTFEMTSRHKSGNVFHWEMKPVPIYVNHQITGAFVICKDITAKKSIEKALKDRETQYRMIADNMTDMLGMLDLEGNILFATPSCGKVLGLAEESFRGKKLIDYLHPEDKDTLRREIAMLIETKRDRLMRYRILHADGAVLHLECMGTPVFCDGGNVRSIIALGRDITEKVKIEKALIESEERYRQSEERYRRLVELSPVAIATYKDGKITYINPSGMKMVGKEFHGDKIETDIIKDWVHPAYQKYATERMENTLLTGFTAPGEFQIIRTDGQVIDISMLSIYDSKSSSIQLMFEDITVRKQSQRKLIESEFRHYRLLTSLDRFSRDLFGVMKVSQLERRLVREVREVIKSNRVSLQEVEHNEDRLCEIIETDEGYHLKIGEIRGRSYLLCIDEKPASLQITTQRVWLQTIARYVSVLFDNFLLIEDLSRELEQSAAQQVGPTWLLRLLFNISENERKRLSQDLHDAALQEQIIWYRKLDLLMMDESITGDVREQLGQIAEGLLDVIHQIRITCNELRPPLLTEEGLTTSLEALFDFTQLRTNYCIQFDAADYDHTISDVLLIGLYRIVQELLANATKHSRATVVRIALSSGSDHIRLTYEDNGVGMDFGTMKDSYNRMGIHGMKERVRSMNGLIEFGSSKSNGLAVSITIPANG
ncbi:PAS domain S-box protein [Cohnella cholangitidis]|uniref:histidine kinase n=1 Tax=Cohnella cholangitidis TaxID=2598458 RepID=A0A7G5BYE0_9BACL|nr:PAS domain S-box protein [Cohnella cholangitidis]QMV41974.1 PAS domain S-box protein [Cohnella cholangitidis]